MKLVREAKKEPKSKVSLVVTIDKEDVESEREGIIAEFIKNAKIPGFRKGKAPREIVISKFKESIEKETISNLLDKSLRQIIKEDEYYPISDPVITEIGELEPGKEFSFKAEFDVMPEIPLKEYKGLKATKYIYDISDEDLQRELDELRERFATLVSTDRKAKVGDYVVIDYEELDEEGNVKSKKSNQTILLDKEDDPLVKNIVGMKVDDEKTFTISQEYEENNEKKVYTTTLRVVVKDVKEKELPELDDDFAKDISDVETLDELKKKIMDELKKDAERMGEEKTKGELINRVIELNEFEVPESLIDAETENIISGIARSYKIDLGRLRADREKYEEYKKNLRPRAIYNIKYELLLSEIAKKEGLEATDEEVDKEIEEYAKNNNRDFNTLKDELIKNNYLNSIRYRITLNKALDFLYNTAEFQKEEHLKYREEEVE